MTLNEAIKMLETEYEEATKLEFINNPLAYALHKVWKSADREQINYRNRKK